MRYIASDWDDIAAEYCLANHPGVSPPKCVFR